MLSNVQTITALMLREMATRYGRSPGGYLWAVIEPVAMIALLSIIFSLFLRSPPIGDSFAMFYATGFIPFFLFNDVAASTGNSVNFNRPLMHFPVVTPLDSVFARFVLSTLTLIVVSVVVLGALVLWSGQSIRVNFVSLGASIGSAALLGLGIGATNAYLFSFYPVWRSIWGIASRPLVIISGVFFTFETMPAGVKAYLWYNPLIHVIGEARVAFFYGYEGEYVNLYYACGIGIGAFVFGAFMLMRGRSRILENA